jgi:signal transduction histidine kinase
MSNLLQNAKNHTPKGSIKITAHETEIKGGGFITVTVSDTGDGVAPELLPNIFDRGITDGSGTGLGLAICKDITESHGGEIKIESELNKGTAVTFTLPVYKEGEADAQ